MATTTRPSMVDLASRLGVSHSTISRLTSGQRRPSRSLLGRIIDEFQLDPAEALELMRALDHETDRQIARRMAKLFARG